MYQDETLTCRDCGKEFVFTASEQAFYAEKGFQAAPLPGVPCSVPCPERRRSPAARNVHRDLRGLRQGDPGSLPAARRQAGVLPRLLREPSSAALLRADGLVKRRLTA